MNSSKFSFVILGDLLFCAVFFDTIMTQSSGSNFLIGCLVGVGLHFLYEGFNGEIDE